jgi:hypothetical protein
MKRGLFSKLRLIAGVALSVLLVTEVALRIAGKDVPPPYPPRLRHPEFQLYEPLGYRLFPSRTVTLPYPPEHPRDITITSNRDGFRASLEFDERDERPRILFLGDGLVSGDGDQESERFTNLLQILEPSKRMDNLGMKGYGPDLMLRSLEVVGLRLKPSVVVFCFGTDGFRRVRPEYDGVGFPIPRYRLESGHLVTVPYPAPAFWNQLRISIAAEKAIWEHTSRQSDLNKAILDRFDELGTQNHFQRAFVFLPGSGDNANDRERRAWLSQYAESNGIAFLDPSDAIHQSGFQAFFDDNLNYNPVGHQVLAREIDRFLRERIQP